MGITYFVLLALILVHFGLCFNNYLRFHDIFDTAERLLGPCIFLVALFIYFSYELIIKIYERHMAEYLKT